MAPAIAHFLVGGTFGLLLLIAASYVRPQLILNRLRVIVVGGVIGIAPDFHHAVEEAGLPYAQWFKELHGSPVTDVFFLHYTLDSDLVRSMYVESIFFSILLFTVIVGAAMYRKGEVVRERSPEC